MKKKGFTLIELLAVIVILAIIALIATPLVLKYIEKSRKESKVDSAYSFVRNLETEIANFSIKNNGKKYTTDKENIKELGLDITVKGENPTDGKVCISNVGQIEKGVFEYNNYYVSYDGKKVNTSDKDTFDNFSCSGNSETVMEKQTIEFIEKNGELQAILGSCIDPNVLELGNYYNIKLIDSEGKIHNNKLISQNSANYVTSTKDLLPVILSHPKEKLLYIQYLNQNLCGLILYPNEDGSYIYNGKYDIIVESNNEKVEPNYLFRMVQDGDYIGEFSFFSSELKSGDEVKFEFANGKTYTLTVCESCTEDRQNIYNKQYYKFLEKEIPYEDKFFHYIYDVNVIVNSGEKIYNFKKEDFIETIAEIGDKHYHVGNIDIHETDF